MPGPQPIVGVTGFYVGDPELTPEQRSGGPSNPNHGRTKELQYSAYSQGYAGHGPYGLDNQFLTGISPEIYTEAAGQVQDDPEGDLQPITHAAPWPKGLSGRQNPQDVHDGLVESFGIHSSAMGYSRAMTHDSSLVPTMDTFEQVLYETAGDSIQSDSVPRQIGMVSGGYGSTDREQSLAIQNQYGFDEAHVQRNRYGTGHIPGNYMWLEPGSRPMISSAAPQSTPVIPIGPDSPFSDQIAGQPWYTQGQSILYDLPVEYQQPPDPNLSSASLLNSPAPADVSLW
jgi:hypothetical protein